LLKATRPAAGAAPPGTCSDGRPGRLERGWPSGPQCAARPWSPHCSACESAPAAAGGCCMTTVRRNTRAGNRMTTTGHEDQFPLRRLGVRFGSRKETIVVKCRYGRDAPIPDLPGLIPEREIRRPMYEIEAPATPDFRNESPAAGVCARYIAVDLSRGTIGVGRYLDAGGVAPIAKGVYERNTTSESYRRARQHQRDR
jgi:hypothetical protein